MHTPSRRAVLVAASALVLVREAHAEPEDMTRAIAEFTGGITPRPGLVALDIAPLVENGNSVSVAAGLVHGAVPPASVVAIALFNEKNPQPNVITAHFGPRSGSPRIATRIRLATTQHIAAVAKLGDGSFHIDRREVIVTLAACTEE